MTAFGRIGIYIALALVAAWFVHGMGASDDGEVVQPRARTSLPRPDPTGPVAHRATLDMNQVVRQPDDIQDANPFAPKTWVAAPVVTPAPAQAPVVQAAPELPPLPFRYAGKVEVEPGHWLIYLLKGEQSFAVTKGDIFDANYRYDGIQDGNVVIQYLPLKKTQMLPINSDS